MHSDWNSFVQSKSVQIAMYSICVFFCVYYAVDSILEMMSPERSAAIVANIGAAPYYALAIIRCIVLAITGLAFARIVYKIIRRDDGDSGQ